MIDVLLINPSYSKMHKSWISEVAKGVEPPLGISYIASYLEQNGITVNIVDALVEQLTPEEIKERIKKLNPKIVGVTVTTPMAMHAMETLKLAKEINPEIITVMGGAHPSAIPKETLGECKELDFCVIGEGEETALELFGRILGKNKVDLKDIKGIAYRDGVNVIITEPRQMIKNISKLPFPARHLLPMDKYSYSPIKYKISPGTNIITSRGCPYNCLFCTKHVFGRICRIRTCENVLAEMKDLIDKYKIKEFHFYDDTFTLDKEYVKKVCHGIIDNKWKIKFWINGRVDTVNPEMLSLLKKAGCYRIYYGMESSTQRLINILNKKDTVEQIINASKMTRAVGIEVYGFFILGIPTETLQEIEDTVEFAKKYCDYAHFTALTPYPGTELWRRKEELGRVKVKEWKDIVMIDEGEPTFVPFTLTEKELTDALAKAYKSFAFRPKFVLNIAKEIVYQPSKIVIYSKGLLALLKKKD